MVRDWQQRSVLRLPTASERSLPAVLSSKPSSNSLSDYCAVCRSRIPGAIDVLLSPRIVSATDLSERSPLPIALRQTDSASAHAADLRTGGGLTSARLARGRKASCFATECRGKSWLARTRRDPSRRRVQRPLVP